MTDIDVEAVEEIDGESEGSENEIEAPEYVLYGGKGGVGKTTMAAATALASAREDVPTLVVSTDPAHSLSDVLDRDVPAEPDLVHSEYPLYGVEIDPEEEGDDDPFGFGSPFMGLGPFGGGMIGGDMPDGGGMAGGVGADGGVGRGGGYDDGADGGGGDPADASMPGADEAAALRLLLQYLDDERFERVVVDTAPTGHTLRLFELPDRLSATLDRMSSVRERFEGMFSGFGGGPGGPGDADDAGFPGFSNVPGFGGAGEGAGNADGGPFSTDGSAGIADLRDLHERLETLEAALSDPERTDFRIVVVPERTSVVESRRLLDRLDAFGIPVGTIVVNRVMENVAAVLGTESGSETNVDGIDSEHEHGSERGDEGSAELESESDHDHDGNTDDENGAFVAPRPDSCPFCRHRLRSQMDALGDADDLFRGRAVKRVPLFATEVRGEELLHIVAACLA